MAVSITSFHGMVGAAPEMRLCAAAGVAGPEAATPRGDGEVEVGRSLSGVLPVRARVIGAIRAHEPTPSHLFCILPLLLGWRSWVGFRRDEPSAICGTAAFDGL